MLLPLTILSAALLAAAVTAYGADPHWVLCPHGLEVILLSRRLQWPLMATALLACAFLIAMVAGGTWRAWWLIGLAPILALFGHRFLTDPARGWQVDAQPSFVTADQASFVHDDDYIVGLSFDGQDFAYPYSVLYENPVVAQAKPRRRLLLLWSAFANRAMATEADWTVKPRDLEVVSMPANALLVYNSELGQFINGVTGLTPDGRVPTGFDAHVATVKMPWKLWRKLHPQTQVLIPPDGSTAAGPTQPLVPRYPIPHLPSPFTAPTQVAWIDTPHPTIIRESDIGAAPLNLLVGSDPLLLLRDSDGSLRAFLRQANGDLTPRFYPDVVPGHPSIVLTEHDSNSAWAIDGRAVTGPLKGEKLRPYDVDERVYLEVIRYWYPNLAVIVPTPGDVGRAPAVASQPRVRQHRRSRRARVQLTSSS